MASIFTYKWVLTKEYGAVEVSNDIFYTLKRAVEAGTEALSRERSLIKNQKIKGRLDVMHTSVPLPFHIYLERGC